MSFWLLFCLLSVCLCHICILNPPQRGQALPTPLPFGSDACYVRHDCSNDPAGPVAATWKAGSTVTVVAQQNLNHFTTFMPGWIDVGLKLSGETVSLTTKGDWPAHEQVTQTNYTLSFTVPSVSAAQRAVLVVRYVSNNPDEVDPQNNTQAIFWNCADVEISAGEKEETPAKPRFAASVEGAMKGCCAPSQFQMVGVEVGAFGTTKHTVYWDATNARTRWDKVGSDGSSTSLYNDYNSLKEYVYDRKANTCELFGPDAFYGWCFGGTLMSNTGQQQTSSGLANVWVQGSNQFVYGSLVKNCLPAFVQMPGSNITFSQQGNLTSATVFDPPSMCLKSSMQKKGCRKN